MKSKLAEDFDDSDPLEFLAKHWEESKINKAKQEKH